MIHDDDAFWAKTVLHDRLPHCGCGSPVAVTELVLEILSAVSDDQEQIGGTDLHARLTSLLVSDGDPTVGSVHPGVYWFVLYALDDAGLIDHGTNVAVPWLTDDGKHLLAILRSVSAIDVWEDTIHLAACCPVCGHDLTGDDHDNCPCAWCARNWRFAP